MRLLRLGGHRGITMTCPARMREELRLLATLISSMLTRDRRAMLQIESPFLTVYRSPDPSGADLEAATLVDAGVEAEVATLPRAGAAPPCR
jgi:hypothetical protein